MSSPPALAPVMTSLSFAQTFAAMRPSATEMKSVNVVRLLIIRPASCHFAPRSPPAAHVRERHRHAAVEQAHGREVEADVVGDPVGAVAVEQQRAGAVFRPALLVDERHGNLHAVGRFHPEPLFHIHAGQGS